MRKSPPEQTAFLKKKKNHKGLTWEEVTALFNKHFRTKLSVNAIRSRARRLGLKNGLYYNGAKHKIYTEKQIEYLRKIVPGRHQAESLKLFNERFGFSLNIKAFSTLYKKHGIQTGFTGYYPKGNVPFNKGRKGVCAAGSEKGWFQKGHISANWRPVGSERISVGGYVEVKYADRPGPPKNRWKTKHAVIWENEHGKIPKGHIVIFLDGNKRNFALNNLMMISRRVHYAMCCHHLYTNDREVTKANLGIIQISVAVSKLKMKSFKGIKNKKMVFLNTNGYRVYVIKDKGRFISVRETKAGNLVKSWVKKLKPRATRQQAQKDLYEYALFRGWTRV